MCGLRVIAATEVIEVEAASQVARETLRFEGGDGHSLAVDRIERAERLAHEEESRGETMHLLPMAQTVFGLPKAVYRACGLRVANHVMKQLADEALPEFA